MRDRYRRPRRDTDTRRGLLSLAQARRVLFFTFISSSDAVYTVRGYSSLLLDRYHLALRNSRQRYSTLLSRQYKDAARQHTPVRLFTIEYCEMAVQVESKLGINAWASSMLNFSATHFRRTNTDSHPDLDDESSTEAFLAWSGSRGSTGRSTTLAHSDHEKNVESQVSISFDRSCREQER